MSFCRPHRIGTPHRPRSGGEGQRPCSGAITRSGPGGGVQDRQEQEREREQAAEDKPSRTRRETATETEGQARMLLLLQLGCPSAAHWDLVGRPP